MEAKSSSEIKETLEVFCFKRLHSKETRHTRDQTPRPTSHAHSPCSATLGPVPKAKFWLAGGNSFPAFSPSCYCKSTSHAPLLHHQGRKTHSTSRYLSCRDLRYAALTSQRPLLIFWGQASPLHLLGAVRVSPSPSAPPTIHVSPLQAPRGIPHPAKAGEGDPLGLPDCSESAE